MRNRFGILRAPRFIFTAPIAFVLAVGLIVSIGPMRSTMAVSESAPAGGYLLTIGEAERGKQQFVAKGCVVCHSVNGVGGRVGPALGLGKLQEAIDVFSMMARMWQGASTMIVLQEMQLGYQIDLTGDELADIVSFLSNRAAQESFSEEDVPPEIRRWMMDEVFEQLNPDVVPQ